MRAISSLIILLIVLLYPIFPAKTEVGLKADGLPHDFHQHIIDGQQKIEEVAKPEEFSDEDLSFTEVKFKPALKKYIEVSDEVKDMSGKNFETARFPVNIYDAKQQLLASKSFYVPQFDYKRIKSHEIHFEEGYYF